MKAVIKAGTIQKAVGALTALVTECRMHITEDSMETKAVDSGNCSMVSLKMPRGAFTEYQGKSLTVGLDLAPLQNFISLARPDEDLALEFVPKGLHVAFGSMEYTLLLLDEKTIRKDPAPPTFESPVVVKLKGGDLLQAVKGLGKMGAVKVQIKADQKGKSFRLGSPGNTDTVKVSLQPVDGVQGTGKCWYTYDLISEIARTIGEAEEVQVSFGTDLPITFTLEVAGCPVTYILAPMVDVEEGDVV